MKQQLEQRPETRLRAISTRRTAFARGLFDGISRDYDGPAQFFSFFQYFRWRRFLVSRLALTPESNVLDVATGPGGVALAMARGSGCKVVGLDISGRMLQTAQDKASEAGLGGSVSLIKARAEDLPFADGAFDAVVFTFLLRYVQNPATTILELSRVLKPGGQMASLEFHVPPGPLLRPLWVLYTRLVLPTGARLITDGWAEVGSFLGPSISRFYRRYSLEDVEAMWTLAGVRNVHAEKLSLGGTCVMWGRKDRT